MLLCLQVLLYPVFFSDTAPTDHAIDPSRVAPEPRVGKWVSRGAFRRGFLHFGVDLEQEYLEVRPVKKLQLDDERLITDEDSY